MVLAQEQTDTEENRELTGRPNTFRSLTCRSKRSVDGVGEVDSYLTARAGWPLDGLMV